MTESSYKCLHLRKFLTSCLQKWVTLNKKQTEQLNLTRETGRLLSPRKPIRMRRDNTQLTLINRSAEILREEGDKAAPAKNEEMNQQQLWS